MQILLQEAEHAGLQPQRLMMGTNDCFVMAQERAATTDKTLMRCIQTAIFLWKNQLIMPVTALGPALN